MKKANCRPGILILLQFFVLYLALFAHGAEAWLVDRVVAFVDNQAITLSELRESYEHTKKIQPDISMEEVLNTMINRLLLLGDARRLKIEGKSDDEVLAEYVELKVKALIRIKEESIEDYYKKNEQNFQGAQFEAVRDKIEEYLLEKEANERLKQQISELHARAYVKILPGALNEQ